MNMKLTQTFNDQLIIFFNPITVPTDQNRTIC